MAIYFHHPCGFSAVLLIGSFIFTESLPPEKRISGGISIAFKNYGTLLKDKSFLGQSLVQLFAFGGFFAYISGSSLYTKTSSTYLHKSLVICLVSIVVDYPR